MKREQLKELVREVLAEATQQEVEAFVADVAREWLSARFGPLSTSPALGLSKTYRAARHRERPARMDALNLEQEEGT